MEERKMGEAWEHCYCRYYRPKYLEETLQSWKQFQIPACQNVYVYIVSVLYSVYTGRRKAMWYVSVLKLNYPILGDH